MEMNITQTNSGYRFENRENQRQAARAILSRQGAAENTMQKVFEKTIFNSTDGMLYSSAQLSIIKASTQMSINGTLKETLKYLKNKSNKKTVKEPVLGELWDIFSKEKQEYPEIVDLEFDFSAENIFAA